MSSWLRGVGAYRANIAWWKFVETAHMTTEESHRKSADWVRRVCLVGAHTRPERRGKSVVPVKQKPGSGGV